MSVRLGVCQVIEGNDLHVTIEAKFFMNCSKRKTTDTTKTINANTNGRGKTPLMSYQNGRF